MEEKMMILKMLQEGKITTEEAYKLLEAISSSGSKSTSFKDEFSSKLNEMKIDEKLNKFGEKAAKFAESIGEKAERFVEQFSDKIDAEKINYNTEKFSEEFSKRMESLGHEITESAGRIADMFSTQLESIFDIGYEKYTGCYSYPCEESADIQLIAKNFSIKTIPCQKQNIIINVTANTNIPEFVLDEYFKAILDGSCYKFSCELPGRSWGKIEIQVPENFEKLNIETDNGKCEIMGIQLKDMNCSTNNGKIYISKCSCDSIELLTDNGRVIIGESTARTANIRTSNAKIDIADCKIDNIDAKTTNGAIELASLSKYPDTESRYILNTTNGKINVLFHSCSDDECMVEASTTMGNINVALSKLVYTLDRKDIGMHSSASVKSNAYDTSSNRIYINAVTTNAPINIAKCK